MQIGIRIKASNEFEDRFALTLVGGWVVDGPRPKFAFRNEMRRREEDPKFKSVKTPYGSLSLKKQQPKWNYDDQALTSWLNDNGYDHLIRVKWEPVKTDIKKAFSVSDAGVVVDPNSEPVEGILVEHRGDELVIKPEV